jgi:hypothetical protein
MSHLAKPCGLSSICLAVALLSSLPAQADDLFGGSAGLLGAPDNSLGASVFFADSGASLVGSLIQVDGHLDIESGEVAMSAADSRSAGSVEIAPVALKRIGMARPQIRSLATNAAVAPVSSVSSSTSRDAFRFSRTAFPLLIDTLPGVREISFAVARPMVGPVVGVRPAYVKASSYR